MAQADGDYFRNNFNTPLTADEEWDFQEWAAKEKAKGKLVGDDDYDIRGYWKSIKGKPLAEGHGPDTYKKPNHPTFSDESIYHGTPAPDGSRYRGGHWGSDSYTPSREMLKSTHDAERMKEYMKRVEPGVKLILPSGAP